MNKLTILIWFALSVGKVYSQRLSNDDITKFRVKSVEVTWRENDKKLKVTPFSEFDFYSEQGVLIRQEVREGRKILKRIEFVYDSSNLLKEKWQVNIPSENSYITPNGDGLLYKSYEYNSHKQLIKERTFNLNYLDNKVNETFSYSYDESGNRVREIRESASDSIEITFTYRGSQLIMETWLYADTTFNGQVKYSYNSLGQLMQEIEDYSPNSFGITDYLYDTRGKLIQMKGVETTSYDYNDKGLLIKETRKPTLSKRETLIDANTNRKINPKKLKQFVFYRYEFWD